MSGNGQKEFVNYAWRAFLTQMAVTLIGALTVIATARLLGPAGKGRLTLLVMIPVLAVAFLHLGIGQATVFYAPRAAREPLVATSSAMVAASGLLAVVIALPLVLIMRGSLFRGIPASWLVFTCVLIPVALFYDLYAALFQALYRIPARNFLVLSGQALNLFLFLLLAGAWKMGVPGGMIAWGLAYFLAVTVAVARMASMVNPARLRIDRGLGRALLGYGVRSCSGSLLNMLNTRFDFVLVAYFLAPAELGLFAVAVYAAELLWKLPEAVAIVLQPRVAQLPEEEARRFTPRVLRLVLPPLMLAALLAAFFSAPFMRLLFGPAFSGAGPALLILLPGFLASAVGKVLASDLLARGRPLAYSASSAIAFVAMVALDFWLIPRLGIRGAALAATCAYGIGAASMVVFYLRSTAMSLRDLLFPGPAGRGSLRDAGLVLRLLLPVGRREPPGTDRRYK